MLLKLGYIGLSLLMIIIVIYTGFKTIDKTFVDRTKIKNKKIGLVSGLLLWQVYIFIIASTRLVETYDLPPRFPLFFIIPAFVFTAIFIYKNRNNIWIKNINPKHLIYVQAFRIIVETLFVFSVAKGILHKNVSIEGYNMDMLVGFSALIVGYLAFNKLPKKAVVIWNYIGLAVLASVIFVFMTSIYKPELYGSSEPLIPLRAVMYPYLLVASFLMPLAVFIHVLSIVQLSKIK